MTDRMKKTAEDMSITLTKISISFLFIASIILIDYEIGRASCRERV